MNSLSFTAMMKFLISKFISALLLCLMLLASPHVFAQEKPLFTGIGPFVIGQSSVLLMDSICKEQNWTLHKIRPSALLDAYPVVELINDAFEDAGGMSEGYHCSEVRSFLISRYVMSGVTLQNVHLYFYRDTLFDFSCDGSNDLLNALMYKYGAPKVLQSRHLAPCKDGEGKDMSPEDVKTDKSWSHDEVYAIFTQWLVHDAVCNEKQLDRFKMISRRLVVSANNCRLQGIQEQMDKAPVGEKPKYKDD
jgi:hypothetical protein